MVGCLLLHPLQAKRPLIVVPNPTYKKWIQEIIGYTDKKGKFVPGILSNTGITLNEWYNLGTETSKVIDFENAVPEKSITLITYEGFKKIGFSEKVMELAVASFALLPNCVYFAKTSWLTGIVHAAHGLDAVRVVPSIDHGLYHPAPRAAGRRLVAAMVRPATPRRAPRRTLRLMARLAEGEFGEVEVVGFGADAEEMEQAGLAVPHGVRMLGRLRQQDVAELMRAADVFLDLSDYQAFGRTAAEAMACGCVALAPRLGSHARRASRRPSRGPGRA